jgi:hypothetical protein
MTNVQVHFHLQRPLDNAMLASIERVHAVYGIQRVRIAPTMDGLTVDYDATRLRPAEVESALAAAGIPVAAQLA